MLLGYAIVDDTMELGERVITKSKLSPRMYIDYVTC